MDNEKYRNLSSYCGTTIGVQKNNNFHSKVSNLIHHHLLDIVLFERPCGFVSITECRYVPKIYLTEIHPSGFVQKHFEARSLLILFKAPQAKHSLH